MSKTAIVMGASIAGLWTARVLADHFDEVVVLERDQLPEKAEFRSGTPQARQYHVMLLRGLQLMDTLFPGMRQELIDGGAVSFDVMNDLVVRSRHRWLEQFPSQHHLLGCSRLLVETLMRRRLRQLPQIRFMEQVEVVGLQGDTGRSAIRAVKIRSAGDATQPQQDEQILQADLVVDALGRRSPTPTWLTELGYGAPQEAIVDSFLGYVSRRYRKPDLVQRDWPILIISATPPSEPRGGLIFPEENKIWVVMMSGANKDYPPVEEQGFHDFARSLGPEFYSVVAEGEPMGKAYGYRGTDSRWRHYEQMDRWPDRFVVLGDAFCGFNPIYGQGMTSAALAAVALGEEIQKANGHLDGVAQRAIKAIGKLTENTWLLATGADLQWPGTVGAEQSQAAADRFGRWYIDQMLKIMVNDPQLRLAFTDVSQMLKPASSLFEPRLMLRVLRQSLQRSS